MPTPPYRAALVALLAPLSVVTACAAPQAPSLSPDDTVAAAHVLLTDRCLVRQGLTPPRPGQRPSGSEEQRRVSEALFGTGPAELTLTLPSGHEVRQHTDGCLAQAQQRLYGDQERWFRASTTVHNLKNRAPASERAAYQALRAHAVRTARSVLQSAHSTPSPPERGTTR